MIVDLSLKFLNRIASPMPNIARKNYLAIDSAYYSVCVMPTMHYKKILMFSLIINVKTLRNH
jgi:hypothetical protein